jgi:hypothetical protein
MLPNDAGQWRRAKRARHWTEAESRRPLHSPGYVALVSSNLRVVAGIFTSIATRLYPIPAHLDAEKVHFSPVGLAFCVLTRF